ncbi:MAG: type IV secretion system protein VirB10 [Rhodospirillaceae bacterium]
MKKKPDPSEVSEVFARAAKVIPRVPRAENPWVMPLGLVGAVVLGVTVFSGLSKGRDQVAEAATPAPVAAPPIELAPPPPPAPEPVQAVVQAPQPPVVAAPDPYDANLRAPAVIYDAAAGTAPVQVAQAAPAAGQAAAAAPAAAGEDNRMSADERFAARISGAAADSTQAYRLANVTHVVAQGTIIPAVLETALDSDLPGSVRGVVSRDVKSFDGARTLIPRGSALIGQYKSAVAEGQSRAFVIWSRVITPAGVAVDIGSPATDRLGRGGLDGEVDTHFFRRFGAAILLSVVDAGIPAALGSGNNTSLIIASPGQANRVAEIALQRQIDIPVTIRVPQGAPVQVFVARDLDFSNVVQ